MNKADNSPDYIIYFPKVYEKLSGRYHQARFSGLRGMYDLNETITLLFDLFRDLKLDPKTLKVLDVGCGTGKVSIPIAKTGADVTCLDASPGMLEQCCKRAVENRVNNHIHLKVASAEQIPYGPAIFDYVVSSRFLHLFPKSYYPMFINEMLRVVKPKGYVVVEIKNKYYGFFINKFRDRRKARLGETCSSMLSIDEIHHLQDQLVDGHIEKVVACQLPKAYLLSSNPVASAFARRLSRTVLSPIAFFYFAVIRKC